MGKPIWQKITEAMQQQRNLARDTHIERQDSEVSSKETPEQTAARLQSMQSPQAEQPAQSYVDANFERPAPKQPEPQTEVLQQGNRPKTRAGWRK